MKLKPIKRADGGQHFEYRSGSCVVKIHESTQTKNGARYTTFWVIYHEEGRRVRKTFSVFDDAKVHAETALTRLVNGLTAATDMRPVELQEAAQAAVELDGTGYGLLAAARDVKRAHELLAGKATILEAVNHYLRSGVLGLAQAKTSVVAKELLAAKTKDGLSPRHLRDLRLRCQKFIDAHDVNISEVTTAQIETWLRGLGAKPRNRNNYARAVTTLFNFAKRAGYLPRDRDTAAGGLTLAKDVGGEVQIFTVEELTRALNRLADFRPRYLPFVAIGAFAGVRSAELARLNWEDFDFEHRLIVLRASKSKTAQRRHIPIQPNLLEWLRPYRDEKGPVVPSKKVQLRVRQLLEKEVINNGQKELGIEWKPNALRHSYGSYRLPVVKSAAELALEMGNSPPMIFRHYRELVKPAEAARYWAIMPPAGYEENVRQALEGKAGSDAVE